MLAARVAEASVVYAILNVLSGITCATLDETLTQTIPIGSSISAVCYGEDCSRSVLHTD